MSRVSIKTKKRPAGRARPLWDKMTTYGAFENQAGVWRTAADLQTYLVVAGRSGR